MSGKRNWGDNMFNRHDGKTPPQPMDGYKPFKVASKLWKKKYKCKKTKGDHIWQVEKIKHSGWDKQKDGTWCEPNSWMWNGADRQLPYWVIWHCAACNKKDYEIGRYKKKFEPFRHTTWQPTQD